MKDIILFDLDNTLANMQHRIQMLDVSDPDWDAFEKECVHDTPIESTVTAAQAFANMGKQVWVWTGRSDYVYKETVAQLSKFRVPYSQLLMRPHGDVNSTSYLKRNWLNDKPVPRGRVLCAYDDDPRIVRMLRDEGLDVFQVRTNDANG